MAEEDTAVEDAALSLDELRHRVRAAEERFERVGEDSRASRRRLVALIRALGDERQRRIEEIEGLNQRVEALDDENAELRVLLAELLEAAEAIDDDEGLSALEGELAAAQALQGDSEPANEEVTAAVADAVPAEADADEDEEEPVAAAVDDEDDLGDDDLEAEVAEAEAALELGSEVVEPAAEEAAEEEPLALGDDAAPKSDEAAAKAEEKSDAETDQLDRILKSIRRITS